MARFVGLDVSQKLTSICVVDDAGRRLWRGQCHTDPEQIQQAVRKHAGDDASIGRSHRRGDGRVATPVDGRHSTHRAFRYFIDDKLTVPPDGLRGFG